MPELRRSARVAARPAPEPITYDEQPVVKKPKKAANTGTVKTTTTTATTESSSSSEELQIGDKLPELTLFDQDENEIDLGKVAKTAKYLVIFAYPKASTPGCTRQACGFQRNYQFLKDNNVTVFGLSSDSPKAQKNFQVKQKLEYSLLCDPSKQLIGPLGAKKSPSGIKRSHWIFVDGVLKVKRIQISPEASIDGAKTEVEQFIKGDASSNNGNTEEKSENGLEEKKEEEAVVAEEAKEEAVAEETKEEPKVESNIDVKPVAEEEKEPETEESKEEVKEEGKEDTKADEATEAEKENGD
ncbi:DOT5 [[Candida] subhashii]|uniref:thioredoxin-dependent peroxiredoxin n=1 Tax=[Candida] subhashii TaxID=561895 RepID=A0A8J5UWF9_9ASCO|nr:DOT5 [[Candida] subhashii]KAG7662945.1 DOT5 [[Candida] subhashii]